MSPATVVCLFVKSPVPGRVKTRLALDLGEERACRIYFHLAGAAVAAVHASGLPLALFFDGDAAETLPAFWRNGAVHCRRQHGSGLGERMADAFGWLFGKGYRSALLCGSDIVGWNGEYLRQGAAALERSGMVIAPAYDGGYGLIGFTAGCFTPGVFKRIAWSTDRVLAQTLARCGEFGLEPQLLEMVRDIDTIVDLREAAPELLAIV